MEKVQLLNGKVESFITSENDSWKFYLCSTYGEAKELMKKLSNDGAYCEIDDDSHGWFVRVKKQ